jgi:PAS domain-containing protein
MSHDWITSFPGAITVCNAEGLILEMNEKALEVFKEDGGSRLIGLNLLDCHPEPARSHVETMLRTQKPNQYTIEKKGIKKLIYQVPWYREGVYSGFVELSLPVPFDMPHFVRLG